MSTTKWTTGEDGGDVFDGDTVIARTSERYRAGESRQSPTKEERDRAALLAAAPDAIKALKDLFEHCAMIHKHWGEGDNRREADAAEKAGKELVARFASI